MGGPTKRLVNKEIRSKWPSRRYEQRRKKREAKQKNKQIENKIKQQQQALKQIMSSVRTLVKQHYGFVTDPTKYPTSIRDG